MDTDPDTANWTLEFLLRQSLDDRTLKSLLRALPLPNDNPNLKKTLLLKKLEYDVSRNPVSVTTLEILEQLEETEYLRGNETVSDTMKRAYCAVAVECTVKNLQAGDDEGKSKRYEFFDAVKAVWRDRIARMKKTVEKGGLISEELWVWRDEIEEAVWDDKAVKSVVKKSEKVNGVEAVTAYLKEETDKMGASFLELVAERVESDEVLQGIMGVGGVDVVAGNEAPPLCGVNEVAPRCGVNEVAPLCGVNEVAPPCGVNEVAGGCNASKEMNRGKIKLREKHLVSRRSRGLPSRHSRGAKIVDSRGLPSRHSRGAKIVDPDETTNEASHREYNVPSSAEVRKAQEALESSLLDLKAVVKDPLPDALKLAEEVEEARNNNHQLPAEDNPEEVEEARNNNHQLPAEDNQEEVEEAKNNNHQLPAEDNQEEVEEARNNNHQLPAEDNHASTAGVAQAPVGSTSNVPRSSLMERNSTAHTCEWDESIDESEEDRIRLPSPRTINNSPLNHYQFLKPRRKPRKWSLEEEDVLRAEVDKYGKGQWKLILSLNRDTFEGRTEVDLKDKWRNLIS